MLLEAKQTQAICIDIQERLFPHIHEYNELARRSAILIRGLQLLEVPIHVTEQYVKGLGETIPSIREALDEYDAIEKITFSCCGSTDIEANILGSSRHHVLLFGIETHVCVLQTALDLIELGRTVIVVEDCVSSRSANDKRIAIERMRQHGAVITTMESILFEFLREAGTETFKKISALVK
ncbi:MAG: hydrolase [Ignavibacteria bacterium]|nr:hydrolase [Ignavibacteria bacterium]